MAISGTKGQAWRAIPTQYRKASDIITSTLAAFLFSSHTKRERDREAHLNYCNSADNWERTSQPDKVNMEWRLRLRSGQWVWLLVSGLFHDLSRMVR